MQLLVARASMTGFVIFDYADRYAEGVAQLAKWLHSGELRSREDVVQGDVDEFPDALLGSSAARTPASWSSRSTGMGDDTQSAICSAQSPAARRSAAAPLPSSIPEPVTADLSHRFLDCATRRIEQRTSRSLSRPKDVAELCLAREVRRRLM